MRNIHSVSPADIHGLSPADIHWVSPADIHGLSPADIHGVSLADIHGRGKLFFFNSEKMEKFNCSFDQDGKAAAFLFCHSLRYVKLF